MKTSRYDELVKETNETFNEYEAKDVTRWLKKVPQGKWEDFVRDDSKDLFNDILWFAMQYFNQLATDTLNYPAWTELTRKTENVGDPKIRQMYRQVLARIPQKDWEGFEIKRAQWGKINLKRGKSALDRMTEYANAMTEKNRDKAADAG